MITRLIWTIWTPMASVPKKANKLNLSLSLELKCRPSLYQYQNPVLLNTDITWVPWHLKSSVQQLVLAYITKNIRHHWPRPCNTSTPAAVITILILTSNACIFQVDQFPPHGGRRNQRPMASAKKTGELDIILLSCDFTVMKYYAHGNS